MKQSRYPTKLIVDALLANQGLIAAAARQLGCSPETIRSRARRSSLVQQAIHDGRERLLDMTEEKLVAAIADREAWAIALVLKTLGKDRGYVERQETVNKSETLEIVTRVVRRNAAGD